MKKTLLKKSLMMELDKGMVDGKQKVETKAFGRIRAEAADEDMLTAGKTFAGLQSKPLLTVKKVEVYQLED